MLLGKINIFFTLVLVASSVIAQNTMKIEDNKIAMDNLRTSATPRLNSPKVMEELYRIGGNPTQIKLSKLQEDTLGSIRNFFVSNLVTNEFDQVQFQLIARGNLCQVWCSTEELDNGHLSQVVADSLLLYLENKSGSGSVDPQRGVISIDQEYFGNAPNKDGDGMLDVLVTDIKDGWEPGAEGGYTAGFFYSVDQWNDIDIRPQYRSNERDIIYIDSYPNIYFDGDIRTNASITTTAHEYQHLIHFNYDREEYTFVNEGLSENAEYVTGLHTRESNSYLSNVNVPIFRWNRNNPLADYSRTSLFYNYIGDRFGIENYKFHTQNPDHGITGMLNAINQSGYVSVTFEELIHDFHIANILTNRTVDEKYGYLNPDRSGLWVPEHSAHVIPVGSGDEGELNIHQGGAGYISFDHITLQNAQFTFNTNIRVSAIIEYMDGAIRVQPLSSDELFELPVIDTLYKKIIYVMSNITPSSDGATTSVKSNVYWEINGAKNFHLHTLNTYSSVPKFYWPIPYYNSSNVGRFGFSNKFTMPYTGTLDQLKLYLVSGINSDDETIEVLGQGQVRISIHQDDAGLPGTVVAEDTVDFVELVPEWNTFEISSWRLQFKEDERFHVVYEVMVPSVNRDINSIPLRLDDGKGSQGVTKIVTGSGEFTDMFTDSESNGEHGVWNDIIISTLGPESPIHLSAEAGDAQILVRWAASIDPTFSKYKIYYGTSTNPKNGIEVNEASIDSLQITGLTNGASYYFSITSIDDQGRESVRSDEIVATPLSNEIAEFSVGALQNPIFTQKLDIYIASILSLDPESVEARISVNDQSTALNLTNSENSDQVYKNTTYELNQNGNIEIVAEAKLPNARYANYDTLTFSASHLQKNQVLDMYSTDETLRVKMTGSKHEESTWFTIFTKKNEEHISKTASSEELVITQNGYTIGPSGKMISAELNWTIEHPTPRNLFIAQLKDGLLEVLPTYFDAYHNLLRVKINSTGSYFVVLSNNALNQTEDIPDKYALKQNFPNPFNPNTIIPFELPTAEAVKLDIFNVLGQKVQTIFDGNLAAGYHQLQWLGLNDLKEPVASGIYFYRIQVGNFSDIRKMLLAR